MIDEADTSKTVIFSLGTSAMENSEDTTLNDAYGNEKVLYANHAYAVSGNDDGTVTLINPHDTSEELTFNREDLHNLPTYKFQGFDIE